MVDDRRCSIGRLSQTLTLLSDWWRDIQSIRRQVVAKRLTHIAYQPGINSDIHLEKDHHESIY